LVASNEVALRDFNVVAGGLADGEVRSCELRALPTDPDALLTTAQAAELLGLSARTLEKWRVTGAGPRFVDMGVIRYRRRDLLVWVEARLRRSTSDSGGNL
jgi:hypothetical protein